MTKPTSKCCSFVAQHVVQQVAEPIYALNVEG